MSNKFFINCDEATTICDKNQYKEASFWEKIKLNIHFLICKKCGLYSKQNTLVSKVCDKHLRKCETEHKFSDKEKKALQKKVTEKL